MITLRPATSDDAGAIFEWATDPETRRMSFSTDEIRWETHVSWLEDKLADVHAHLFIGVLESSPIGYVRFDLEERVAVISVAVAPAHRGRKLATPLIRAGLEVVREMVDTVEAQIKPGNGPSIAAFLRAGFTEVRRKDDRVVMTWPTSV